MNNYLSILSNLIIILILVIIPSLKNIGDCYYLFSVFTLLLLFIFAILVSKLKTQIKITIIIILFLVYKNTFIIVGNFVFILLKLIYIDSLNDRKDNKCLMKLVKPIYSTYFNFITNFENLPSTPSIIVCNYCNDRVENLCCILLPVDLAIMMRDQVRNTMKFDKIVKWRIETKKNGSFEDTKKQIQNHTKDGRYIFTYVTKHPKYKFNYISKVRSGVFHIAKELNIPITLLAIDYIDTNFGIIPYQNFRIHVGETFYVEEPKKSVLKCKNFFKDTLTDFINTKYKL